ncbi:MAG: Uncharacterized protein XD82_1152 [Methanoculleus marisnigri]|uniref:Uncharacterized protein n=1 Tax=Methanoculleus marisnigri TaxID=2198 RepID=A0A117LQ59_9EURY|nr:MAG: Uncharacterized protein XD82_1152 [Methanoculleus marisnigri]
MQIASAPGGTILIEGKVVTTLDRFVASVTDIIERYTGYVFVSGYVAILFGRARGTEDIDLFTDYCILSVYFRNFGVWGRALGSHSGARLSTGYRHDCPRPWGWGRRPEAGQGGVDEVCGSSRVRDRGGGDPHPARRYPHGPLAGACPG